MIIYCTRCRKRIKFPKDEIYIICRRCGEVIHEKDIKNNCEVTGVYNDYRSGLTIKKIN